ncbi:formate dehydrogenase accessory sulfurtransferase FdhD [bacterium]|nr:formate dehydrogenase accessory sulfurtransferase FdhD [bacterium]
MKRHNADNGLIRKQKGLRISTSGVFDSIEEEFGVIVEAQLTIDVENRAGFVLMCTPSELDALVVGFLLTEGLIRNLSDIREIKPRTNDGLCYQVLLQEGFFSSDQGEAGVYRISTGGACLSSDLQTGLTNLSRSGDTFRIKPELLHTLGQDLYDRQILFQASGGTHAAGIFDHQGRIIARGEDIGRHNALDKAIGMCLLNGFSPAGQGVILSGRTSLEMIRKCARAGIELVAAVSATTSLALDAAERCNITVCTFVRETRATICTLPHRIITRDA